MQFHKIINTFIIKRVTSLISKKFASRENTDLLKNQRFLLFAHLPNHIVPTLEQFAVRALKRYSENSYFSVTLSIEYHTRNMQISQFQVTHPIKESNCRTANSREFEQLNTSAKARKLSRRMIPVRIVL